MGIISVCILVAVIWKVYHKVKEVKLDINREENENKAEPQVKLHFEEGYETRPNVTGDYFRDSYKNTGWHTCVYENTSICANCARRYERIKADDLYYYGSSSHCSSPRYDD